MVRFCICLSQADVILGQSPVVGIRSQGPGHFHMDVLLHRKPYTVLFHEIFRAAGESLDTDIKRKRSQETQIVDKTACAS